MAKNQSVKGNFNYNNIEKKDKNFMYKNLRRSNCYNCNFSNSNFNFSSFRGAHFKTCNFSKCTFTWAELIGTNLKGSNLKSAKFENTIFDSVNLDGTDFKDAEFKNTIFLMTDTDKAKNLNINDSEIRIYNEMPQIEISENLKNAVIGAMTNKFVKDSRVLDTKDGSLNLLNLMLLLDKFNEETLIEGLNIIKRDLDKDFCTLSYLIKFIEDFIKNSI